MTGAQRRRWNEHGYLLVRNVLTPAEVCTLLAAIEEVLLRPSRAHVIAQGPGAWKVDQAVAHTAALDALVDHPRAFPLLLDLLGPFLQVIGSEIFVREASETQLVDWHTDGGPTLARFLPTKDMPILQMKAQFFLTDVDGDDRGNFMLVPGSHRRTFREGGVDARDAIQLHARAGDLLLFPWSLWHAVAPNRGGHVRKSVTLRYGQLWSRPYDYRDLPGDVLARMTPRRRRLFGDLGDDAHPSTYFYADEDEQRELMHG